MTTTDGEYGRPAFDALRVLPDSLRVGSRRILTNENLASPPYSTAIADDMPEPVGTESTTDGDDDIYAVFDGRIAEFESSDTELCLIGLYLEPSTGNVESFYGCDTIQFTP